MFQVVFTIGIIVVTAELLLGTIPDDPLIRLLAMPVPTVMFLVGGLLLSVDMWHLSGSRISVRISSMPPGSVARPGIYSIVEDVVAVDGRLGRPYREALDARYQASPMFRRTLRRLSFFWSIGSLVVAGVLTAFIMMAKEEVAFGLGWGVPFIWAGLWTYLTIGFVQDSLAIEKAMWWTDVKIALR